MKTTVPEMLWNEINIKSLNKTAEEYYEATKELEKIKLSAYKNSDFETYRNAENAQIKIEGIYKNIKSIIFFVDTDIAFDYVSKYSTKYIQKIYDSMTKQTK